MISDGLDFPEYSFKIEIKHELPKFQPEIVNQIIPIGKVHAYTLPVFNPAT
jgi:hypothetical protein